MTGLLLLAVALTITAYYSLVIPEFRGQSFAVGLITSIIAQLVWFGYLLYAQGAPSRRDVPDAAVRGRVLSLLTVWAVLVVVLGAIGAAPGNADTMVSDRLLIIELALTLAAMAAVVFAHRQAVVVQSLQSQRPTPLRQYAGGLDPLVAGIRDLAGASPAHAVVLDELARRIDTLKNQLLASSPDSDRTEGPATASATESLTRCLHELHDQCEALAKAPPGEFDDVMARVRRSVEAALAAARFRENALTF
jgi:hypothetical protein